MEYEAGKGESRSDAHLHLSQFSKRLLKLHSRKYETTLFSKTRVSLSDAYAMSSSMSQERDVEMENVGKNR